MTLEDRQKQERINVECYLFYKVCNSTTEAWPITSHDTNVTLTIDGSDIVFKPAQIQRDNISRASDDTFDQMTITMNNVEPFLSMANQELIEGINVKVYKVWSDDWKTVYDQNDYELLFWGETKAPTRSDNTISAAFTSWTQRLKISLPQFTHQRTCNFMLYEGNTCGLNEDNFKFSAEIDSISANRYSITVNMNSAGINEDDGVFSLGVLRFSDGRRMQINTDSAGSSSSSNGSGSRTLNMLSKVPADVEAGDPVNLYYGCDRRYTTCRDKFSNGENFGGFPNLVSGNPAIDSLAGESLV